MSKPFEDDATDDVASVEDPWGTTVPPTSVGVTLKAGKGYEAGWINLKGATVSQVLRLFKDAGDDVFSLMKEVNGASVAFQEDYEKRGGTPTPRTYGKPAGADREPEKAPSEEPPPFATSSEDEEQPMYACKHGTRELKVHKGTSYHVCPSGLPKGDPDRCEPITG